MKFKINPQKLGRSLFIIAVILLTIHLLVLFGILPPHIIWDTTITDQASITVSEAIAIFFIILFMIAILAKQQISVFKLFRRCADPILWIMLVYFLLNVIGALVSDNAIGKLLYAPLTLILVILVFLFILTPSPQTTKKKPQRKQLTKAKKKYRQSQQPRR